MPARADLDPDEIRRLYHGEELSIRDAADRLGVSRNTLSRHMADHGIKKRSLSEEHRLAWRRNGNAYDRGEWSERATEHFTGRSQSLETMRKKAQTVYENQSQLSKYERRVRDQLRERGIPAESLWPVERWNIDVAIPDAEIAVEIHGGWHWSDKKRDQDRRKAELLEERGWTLLTFARNHWNSEERPSRDEFVEIIVGEVAETYHRITG